MPRVFAAAVMAASLTVAGFPRQSRNAVDALLAAYEHGDLHVIERTLRTEKDFEKIRSELGYIRNGRAYKTLEGWNASRRPAQAVFLLDLALVGLNNGWRYWLDVLEEARRFVTSRPAPPGQVPQEDAFEIAWHKTAVALLQGQRRPDLVLKHGLEPLANRVVPAPLPSGEPRLTDPWIALARAMAEEQQAIVEPSRRLAAAQAAVERYDEAARYDSTRSEALVRKSWVLLTLGRSSDALASLGAIDDRATDPAVLYWSRLFRGRALEVLGRPADAVRAYEEARAVMPHAQAPAIALMALALREDDGERAWRWANGIRRPQSEVVDPWWDYPLDDFRLFRERLAGLRRAALP